MDRADELEEDKQPGAEQLREKIQKLRERKGAMMSYLRSWRGAERVRYR
jgi:hypothetical protein